MVQGSRSVITKPIGHYLRIRKIKRVFNLYFMDFAYERNSNENRDNAREEAEFISDEPTETSTQDLKNIGKTSV